MDLYEQIVAAAEAQASATAKLRRLVVEAATDPAADRSAIADLAKISRATLYRWLAADKTGSQEEEQMPYGDPLEAMRQALLALLDAGAGPEHELTRGLHLGHRDRVAMARRVLLGAGNLAASGQIDEEQRAVISAGVLAAHHLTSRTAKARQG